MCPVKQRVTYRGRHYFGPGHKFIFIRSIPGDQLLADTQRPLTPPFVMVALQPDLRQVGKLFIFRYFLRREVIVIINNGQVFRILIKQYSGFFIAQQKNLQVLQLRLSFYFFKYSLMRPNSSPLNSASPFNLPMAEITRIGLLCTGRPASGGHGRGASGY